MEVRKSPGFADLIKSLNPNQDSHASKVLLSIFDAMTVAWHYGNEIYTLGEGPCLSQFQAFI